MVAILDADKEGFLRSDRSLIQTIDGRRNSEGKVIMYGDKITDSMDRAIKETERRRKDPGCLQREARHNAANDPQEDPRCHRSNQGCGGQGGLSGGRRTEDVEERSSETDPASRIRNEGSAKNLQFERAAELRDALERKPNKFGEMNDRGRPGRSLCENISTTCMPYGVGDDIVWQVKIL